MSDSVKVNQGDISVLRSINLSLFAKDSEKTCCHVYKKVDNNNEDSGCRSKQRQHCIIPYTYRIEPKVEKSDDCSNDNNYELDKSTF